MGTEWTYWFIPFLYEVECANIDRLRPSLDCRNSIEASILLD